MDDIQNNISEIKGKKQYKIAQFTENICPTVVFKALQYLLEISDMYQNRNIHINDTLLQKFTFQIVKIELNCIMVMEQKRV